MMTDNLLSPKLKIIPIIRMVITWNAQIIIYIYRVHIIIIGSVAFMKIYYNCNIKAAKILMFLCQMFSIFITGYSQSDVVIAA